MKNLIDFISESNVGDSCRIDELTDLSNEMSAGIKDLQHAFEWCKSHRKNQTDYFGEKLKPGDVVGIWTTGGFDLAVVKEYKKGNSYSVLVCPNGISVRETIVLGDSCFKVPSKCLSV